MAECYFFFIWSSCFIYIYLHWVVVFNMMWFLTNLLHSSLFELLFTISLKKVIIVAFLKRSKSVFCSKRSIQVVFCFLFLWGLVLLGNLHLVYIIGQAISIFFPKWFHSTVWISLFLSVLDWLFCQAILC